MQDIIIYGAGPLAEMFLSDVSKYNTVNPVAFTVDRDYLTEEKLCDLPIIPFDEIENKYPPASFQMIVLCTGLSDLSLRKLMYKRAKDKGYTLINYISPGANLESEIKMGDNNIIFSGAEIGLHGEMGSDNIIRQKVYIGHNFLLGSHNILSPGCTIGGFSNIGDSNFLGLSVVSADHRTIGDGCIIGMGSVLTKDIGSYAKAYGNPAQIKSIISHEE